MTDLERLKYYAEERDGCPCRMYTDEELTMVLEDAGGDVKLAAYRVLIRKAKVDGITLPDGTRMESNREYWLALANLYRPNRGGSAPRADEVNRHD